MGIEFRRNFSPGEIHDSTFGESTRFGELEDAIELEGFDTFDEAASYAREKKLGVVIGEEQTDGTTKLFLYPEDWPI